MGQLLERLEEMSLTRLGAVLAALLMASLLVAVGSVASEQVRRGEQLAAARLQERGAIIECLQQRGRANVDACLAQTTPRRAAAVELVRLEALPQPAVRKLQSPLVMPVAYYRR